MNRYRWFCLFLGFTVLGEGACGDEGGTPSEETAADAGIDGVDGSGDQVTVDIDGTSDLGTDGVIDTPNDGQTDSGSDLSSDVEGDEDSGFDVDWDSEDEAEDASDLFGDHADEALGDSDVDARSDQDTYTDLEAGGDLDGSGDAGSDGDTDADIGLSPPIVTFPRASITPAEVGVIVNLDDSLSTEIAAHYIEARGIPEANVLEVSMGTAAVLSAEDFALVEEAIEDTFGSEIQALVLTSYIPYRVDCMGVSAAVALGFDTIYCRIGDPCQPTASVDYYNSNSTHPYDDHGLRPTMILAARTIEDADALIARGIAADGSYPAGEGWFIRTTDVRRSVRWSDFTSTVAIWNQPDALSMTYVDNSDGEGSDVITDETGVLFYFAGLSSVAEITTNEYVPGAVADHLTSFGGVFPGGGQMSILAWLEAGVTASYGTAIEPCNYTSKFPRTSVFVPHYFRGETLIEAYWKSVLSPGEGNFAGEPLARPYGPPVVEWVEGTLTIETTMMVPGQTYILESAPSPDGRWTPVIEDLQVPYYRFEIISVEEAWAPYYRVDSM